MDFQQLVRATTIFAVFGISVHGLSAETAGKRPNVLFLAVDDLRPELGCYGNRIIKSPHIDALARRGVVFSRAYCQQAVCSPSRTSLLTGLRPDSTQVYDLTTHFRENVPDVVTLPEHFRRHGYFTQAFGKIFHGGLDDAQSWSTPHQAARRRMYLLDENHEMTVRKRKRALAQGLTGVQLYNASTGPPFEAADVPDNAYTDGALADMAIDALRKLQRRQEPFFLAVGFIKPHLPFNAPARYWEMYDPEAIPEATNPYSPKDCPAFANSGWHELRAYHGMPDEGPVTPAQARRLKHGYYACVSYVDAQIGRVVDTLDNLGLADETVIVLWGDHGWKLGEHAAWCKHTNFEIDTRVPLIVVAPDAKGAARSANGLVEFVDIYPTLCELAGLSRPKHLEGQSFAALLDDPSLPGDATAISQYPRGHRMGYSMRTDRYRFTRWVERENPESVVGLELYDHRNDPNENENLAGRPRHADLIAELTDQLRDALNAHAASR